MKYVISNIFDFINVFLLNKYIVNICISHIPIHIPINTHLYTYTPIHTHTHQYTPVHTPIHTHPDHHSTAYSGDYGFEISFENQSKETKSTTWTVSIIATDQWGVSTSDQCGVRTSGHSRRPI